MYCLHLEQPIRRLGQNPYFETHHLIYRQIEAYQQNSILFSLKKPNEGKSLWQPL